MKIKELLERKIGGKKSKIGSSLKITLFRHVLAHIKHYAHVVLVLNSTSQYKLLRRLSATYSDKKGLVTKRLLYHGLIQRAKELIERKGHCGITPLKVLTHSYFSSHHYNSAPYHLIGKEHV